MAASTSHGWRCRPRYDGVVDRSIASIPHFSPQLPIVKRLAGCILLSIIAPPLAWGLEHLTFERDGQSQKVSGQVLVTAEDGGLLLLTDDGALWNIEPDQIRQHTQDAEVFVPLSREALGRQLLQDLPTGFETYSTHHYLICHNTSREYAVWCGALFERLYKAFTNYWTRKGIKLHEPEFPLVAIVFNSPQAYARHSQEELGKAGDSIIGYYSLRTNRITMYDLTGVESLRAPGDRRGSQAQINRLLSRPESEQLVATIIHEATHQIAFNTGLQTRFADIPLWVSEGLAMYFETPDLQSSKGWRTIGAINASRLERIREYLTQRPAGSLASLVGDDKRIRDTRTALDAYAEAWALNYYLIHQHPRKYQAYLQRLAEKKPLIWDDPQARLQEFRAAFGEDLGALDTDFVRQMQKLR